MSTATARAPIVAAAAAATARAASAKTSVGTPVKGLAVATLIQRDAVVTRSLSDFEQQYYTYRDMQDRTESRFFHPSFYYKQGTTLEKRYIQMQEKVDPLFLRLVEDRDTAHLRRFKRRPNTQRFPDIPGSATVVQPADPIEVASRITLADEKNDHRDIWRALDRTLFLLIKQKGNSFWQVGPKGPVTSTERLDSAAKRNIYTTLGGGMVTWMVGGYPFAHLIDSKLGESTYFMKSHILAGLPAKNDKIDDMVWVTCEEMEKYLTPETYKVVKDMLPTI